MWTSPPLDILLEVLGHLDVTDVVRCAGTCKPWRRAIIGNASSCLRPHPDRLVADLLLGFYFHKAKFNGDDVTGLSLHLAPGPFVAAFAMPTAGDKQLALYDTPLSCRDGLLLLKGGIKVHDLCLYDTINGNHMFVPAAAFKADTYVLVTGYDLSPSDDLGVCILAVEAEEEDVDDDTMVLTFHHQQFYCATSGATAAWGPVKSSPEFMKNLFTLLKPGNEVVCGGAIHWLGMWVLDWLGDVNWYNWPGEDDLITADKIRAYTLSIDVRTGRTWTTKLPDRCRHGYATFSLVLATSGDGRLSVVMDSRFHGGVQGRCILVWVLVGEDQWSLERTVAVPALNMQKKIWLNNIVFCPRSGCLLVEEEGGDLIIDVDTGSSRQFRYPKPIPGDRRNGHSGYRYPYEMDWSTYLSKMKSF